jgi:glycerol-3-phosphate dehydrogenase (NAD+)
MLTCFGALSRNRTVGVRLGKGESIEAILASVTEVAEGVATAPAALKLAQKHNIDVPIIFGIARLIAGELSAKECLMATMKAPVVDNI